MPTEKQILSQIKVSELDTLVLPLVQAGETVVLVGPPGVGKSQTVKRWAVQKLIPSTVFEIFPAQQDPISLMGGMTMENGQTLTNPPSWFCRAVQEPCTIFIDEFSKGPKIVVSAMAELVLNHRMHNTQLHPQTVVIAATNSDDDMPQDFVRNRPGWFYLTVNLEDSIKFFLQRGYTSVSSYHRFTSGSSLLVLPVRGSREHPFPSPRSWETVGRLVSRGFRHHSQIAAYIGYAEAEKFGAFLDICASLPDPKSVLENPEKAPIPEKRDIQYALIGALTSCAVKFPHLIPGFFTFVSRLDKILECCAVRDLWSSDKAAVLAQYPGKWQKWCADNKAFILANQ
jgi:hypothetical protein